MSEKDDFDSWEPQDLEEEQQQPDVAGQELNEHASGPEPEKPAARRQTVLLLLLLLLAGAAAYVYLGGSPKPEVPQAAAPARKPIALPPPPASSEEETIKTEIVPPAPSAADATKETAVRSEPSVKVDRPAVSAPVAKKGQESTATPAAASLPASAEPATTPEKAAPVKGGGYFLQAGAFLLKDNLRAAEATVRRLGYESQVKTVRRTMPMTRLRVGGFFAEEGAAKLASLKPIAPDAFLVRQGDYVLVYAGSYQDLDRARRVADRLYQQGIRVEEEPTTAEVSLSLLSIGVFADRNAAEQAAVKIRAAGLEAQVRKAP